MDPRTAPDLTRSATAGKSGAPAQRTCGLWRARFAAVAPARVPVRPSDPREHRRTVRGNPIGHRPSTCAAAACRRRTALSPLRLGSISRQPCLPFPAQPKCSNQQLYSCTIRPCSGPTCWFDAPFLGTWPNLCYNRDGGMRRPLTSPRGSGMLPWNEFFLSSKSTSGTMQFLIVVGIWPDNWFPDKISVLRLAILPTSKGKEVQEQRKRLCSWNISSGIETFRELLERSRLMRSLSCPRLLGIESSQVVARDAVPGATDWRRRGRSTTRARRPGRR